MRVNKNLLLQKSNEELEKYLLPNGGYVTDAIDYISSYRSRLSTLIDDVLLKNS